MKKEPTKEEIIQHKKRAIRKLNSLLEEYLSTNDRDLLKKANLLSYWVETFSTYISEEKTFEPSRLLRYKRGDILRVNFGFRVGHEIGGLHFAVVIENHNAHNASVITVVPLSSTDGRSVRAENVDLGTELYQKASDRQNALYNQARGELDQLSAIIEVLGKSGVDLSHPDEAYKDTIQDMYSKQAHLNKLLHNLNRNSEELQKMKSGSMAIMNQITTVSKQRIYVPKKAEDFLYGISLSEGNMNKINRRIIEQLVHQK